MYKVLDNILGEWIVNAEFSTMVAAIEFAESVYGAEMMHHVWRIEF